MTDGSGTHHRTAQVLVVNFETRKTDSSAQRRGHSQSVTNNDERCEKSPKKSIPLNGNASRYATLVFPSPSGIDALSAQCKLHVRHLPASTTL